MQLIQLSKSIITDSSFKLFYGKECINAKEIEVNLSGDFMSWQLPI